jgi:hypothetical protein
MLEFKLWNWIYNFIKYNQVPMDFRDLNLIWIDFELIWIEMVKWHYCTGTRPSRWRNGPAHFDLLAQPTQNRGVNPLLATAASPVDSGHPTTAHRARCCRGWEEPNLRCWRNMRSPVDAGDGEVHGSGKEVDGDVGTRSSAWFFRPERNNGGWGSLQYVWLPQRRTEHGVQ